MENYTNKNGYLICLLAAVVYSCIIEEDSFFSNMITVLLANIFIAAIISFFKKFENFGKVIGISTVITSAIIIYTKN
jgi:FtsH-binding integral membrane protein